MSTPVSLDASRLARVELFMIHLIELSEKASACSQMYWKLMPFRVDSDTVDTERNCATQL